MEGALLRINDPKVCEKQISRDLGMSSEECTNNNQLGEFYKDMKWKNLWLNKEFFSELDALVLIKCMERI